MDNDNLREEIISQIRACLISTKGARDLRQIRNDYYMLMGEQIPHQKLGYKSLEQFICSIPTLKTTTHPNGQILVDARITEKSEHIANFVDKQKTGKRKSRPPPRPVMYRGQQPPRWRPKSVINPFKKFYESSPRPAAVAHKQVISSSKSPRRTLSSNLASRLGPKVEIREVVPVKTIEPLREIQQQSNDSNSLTKQAKRRLSQKMADLVIDSNGVFEKDSSPLQTPQTPHTPNNFDAEFVTWQMPPAQTPTILTQQIKEINRHLVTNTVPNIRITKLVRTGDNLKDLNAFVLHQNLGEVIIKTITKQKNSRHPLTYYCTIQIGDLKYSNYPMDNHDEDSAKEVAAKKALDSLEQQYLSKQQPLLISDDIDILHRIPPMVQVHPCGVWSHEIEENYIKQYKEQLPVNWLEILDTLPYIAVSQIHGRCVLNYCNPNEKQNSNSAAGQNVSVNPNTVNFNDDDSLIAEITCIASAGEIWCHQRETPESNAFFAMVQKLEQFYNSNGVYEKAVTIQIGGHYVALHEQMWCRVRVFEVNDDNIHCFCIDFGDEWVISKNSLYNLKKEFAAEQAQAFVCRLAGIEELYEVSKTSDYLQSFLGKIVQVQAESNWDESEIDPNDPAIPVVLYDPETGDPINEQIITSMSMEMASPSLIVNTPAEAYVTHAVDDGSVYIQIRSKGYEHLMSLIEKAGQNILESKPAITPTQVSKAKCDDLYFIQYTEDGLWYRVKIIDWSPHNEKHAQVMFVDNGDTPVVEIQKTDFYVLHDISEVISKFPYQALQVKLSVKSIPPNFVEKINNLMPSTESVLVKSLRIDVDYMHVVECFKRSESDNILFSVNMTLMTESELRGGDGNNNKSQSKKLQRLISLNQFEDLTKNVPSTGSLSCPFIPEIGNYFDVKIAGAVGPHSFFVQPYESQEKLNKLMKALQERYKDIQYSPIQINDISPGKIYASKHTDGQWYRTCVIKVIHAGSISVFYCDFGNYANLTVQQLIPLDVEFLELPYQAIKAKLADIQPKNSKWSMTDCKYFTELVSKKPFVSILKGTEKDVLYRSDTVYSLKLIDTATSEDICIDQILIDQGIAIPTD